MAAPKVVSGARAKVQVSDPNRPGGTRTIGIYTNISFSVAYDVQPAYILGRYTAAELDYTAVETVPITASGFKVVDHGWFADGSVPLVQDLLLHEYIQFAVFDRQQQLVGNATPLYVIKNVRPAGASVNFAARALSEITMNYVGLLVEEDGKVNAEGPGATDLP